MEWVKDNLFWIVILAVFVWMHARMHGGHGTGGSDGCGGHGHSHSGRGGPPEQKHRD